MEAAGAFSGSFFCQHVGQWYHESGQYVQVAEHLKCPHERPMSCSHESCQAIGQSLMSLVELYNQLCPESVNCKSIPSAGQRGCESIRTHKDQNFALDETSTTPLQTVFHVFVRPMENPLVFNQTCKKQKNIQRSVAKMPEISRPGLPMNWRFHFSSPKIRSQLATNLTTQKSETWISHTMTHTHTQTQTVCSHSNAYKANVGLCQCQSKIGPKLLEIMQCCFQRSDHPLCCLQTVAVWFDGGSTP